MGKINNSSGRNSSPQRLSFPTCIRETRKESGFLFQGSSLSCPYQQHAY